MNERAPAPTGLGRRHRRLTDEETRQRMLRAAADLVARSGLTVSLDHISFEDVIRAAGVARSTAYRHWPYKDLFLSDLIKELATTADPGLIRDETTLIRQVIVEHQDRLREPQHRYDVLLELIRRLAELDFAAVLASPGWRTYVALNATFSSLADGKLRTDVQAALAAAERARVEQIARAWQQLAVLAGYRLRTGAADGYEALAILLSANLRGLVLMAHTTPAVTGFRTADEPFGASGEGQWSLPALGLAAVATSFLEPDPDVTWDDDRLAEIHRILDAWAEGEPAP